MFGREAIDIMYGPAEEQAVDIPQHLSKTKKILESAYSGVRETLSLSHQRQKENHDKKVQMGISCGYIPHKFQEGSLKIYIIP